MPFIKIKEAKRRQRVRFIGFIQALISQETRDLILPRGFCAFPRVKRFSFPV